MTIFFSQRNKNIGIFGLGATGIAAYKILKNIAKVICYDQCDNSRNVFANIYGIHDIVNLLDPRWKELDQILLSPGVPLSHEIVIIANKYNIPIISDIDLLFEECKDASFIAITGTNGKSTTTALIGHILHSSGLVDYSIGGNIGIPALSMKLKQNGYILELSSFQLDLLKIFKAKVALLLNITPDHLDRYGNMDSYIASKTKIFNRMDNGSFAIINFDNNLTRKIFFELKKEKKINVIPFSIYKNTNEGVSIFNDIVYDNIIENLTIKLPNNKYLQGEHNKENIAAAYVACRVIGITPEQIIAAISIFQGLPHRMQYIGMIKEVAFYNDSKATNSDAASKSVAALNNIYWLVGGIAKEGGVEKIKPWFYKVKKVYLFGQDKELLAKTFENEVPLQICQDLEQAFNEAFHDAIMNKDKLKNILLAPACASHDQFKNFEQRGNLFIELYHKKIVDYERI